MLSTPWFKLLKNLDFHVVDYHSDQVIVLPIVAGESILLPKVHRKILGQSVWELPAGEVTKFESSEMGALRELKEETGVKILDADRLTPEHSIVVSPNRLPMFPNIYSINISADEYRSRLPHDREVESVGCFSFETIQSMIKSGEIFTTITLAIIGRFLANR